ncbi:hypothetical protein PCASD_04624 [Puccinia coronata f. sp. avenae]|uniref:HAT C-terminal dimerisation domain-containing protein n=1 Tax=Puccinia coronata f. sp. avenae TaxID=200324 RepID=A0A2N5UXF5_9BASI|nr:hypothetical protein PCASD_04624 [Puccinia coronata f. sp. avenae]
MNNEEDFNILGWWKSNAERFPGLSKLVKVLLMISMTSVASESAFSTGGHVIDNHRTWLNDETVEAVICAQDWLKSSKHNIPPCCRWVLKGNPQDSILAWPNKQPAGARGITKPDSNSGRSAIWLISARPNPPDYVAGSARLAGRQPKPAQLAPLVIMDV